MTDLKITFYDHNSRTLLAIGSFGIGQICGLLGAATTLLAVPLTPACYGIYKACKKIHNDVMRSLLEKNKDKEVITIFKWKWTKEVFKNKIAKNESDVTAITPEMIQRDLKTINVAEEVPFFLMLSVPIVGGLLARYFYVIRPEILADKKSKGTTLSRTEDFQEFLRSCID